MMDTVLYAMITDGTSDRCLAPMIEWTMRQSGVIRDLEPIYPDYSLAIELPKSLTDRIRFVRDYYDPELYFVHRDAEAQDPEWRYDEIYNSFQESGIEIDDLRKICVVPVRMMEAWLLFDESAIRHASGNPRGNIPLRLPAVNRVEAIADPKKVLYEALINASALSGRRLRKFKASSRLGSIIENISDYSPLRGTQSFIRFENQLINTVQRLYQ